MADLKHIKTFESYSTPEVEEEVVEQVEETVVETEVEETEEVNEGMFDGLKVKIDKYLSDPKEGKEDKMLSKAFTRTFANAPKVKAAVMALPFEEKIDILKRASAKLENDKIGVLKLINRAGVWEVGGVPLKAGTGGGMKA